MLVCNYQNYSSDKIKILNNNLVLNSTFILTGIFLESEFNDLNTSYYI